jgi:hypothetical protein
MLKIILVAVLIAGTLALAKSNHWFERMGVLGSCTVLRSPRGDEGQWWACKQGVLTGYPVLRKDGCDPKGVQAGQEVWRCPAPLATVPGAF